MDVYASFLIWMSMLLPPMKGLGTRYSSKWKGSTTKEKQMKAYVANSIMSRKNLNILARSGNSSRTKRLGEFLEYTELNFWKENWQFLSLQIASSYVDYAIIDMQISHKHTEFTLIRRLEKIRLER